MAKNSSHWGAFIFGMIVGAMAGAGAALLLTPRSGEEIRGELLGQTQGVRGRVQDVGAQVQSRAQEVGSEVQTRVQTVSSQMQTRMQDMSSQVQTRVQTVGSQVQTRSQGLIDQAQQVVQRGGTPMKKQDATATDFAGTPPASHSPIIEDAAAADPRNTGPSVAAMPEADTVETGGVSREPAATSEADRDATRQKAEGVKPPEAPDYTPVQPEAEVEQLTNEHLKADENKKAGR